VRTISYKRPRLSSPVSQKPENKLVAQSARTKARLIDTTLKLLATHEIHDMTLDAIASQAGVTKRAIYNHFESKDGLLMAAFFSAPGARLEGINWPSGRDGSVRERLRKLGEAVWDILPDGGPAAEVTAEFMSYALTRPHVRVKVEEAMAHSRNGMKSNILALFSKDELPMPVDAFALMLGAMVPGLVFSRAFSGERVNRKTVLALFEGLAGYSSE
jgi:AcrR family transcriptional regulator